MMPRAISRRKRDEKLGRLLDSLSQKGLPQDRIQADPIAFPHRYKHPEDIEIVAFLSSALAYGRVALFKQVIEKILSLTDGAPYRYFADFDPGRERARFSGIYYRFNQPEDLVCFIDAIRGVIQQYGSLGALFASLYRENESDIGPTLSRFVLRLRKNIPLPISSGLSHLIPSPEQGSACKRLNLFLRWMVRPNDGVDFGLWKKIPPAKLIMPLDTHIVRISGYLGLSTRKSPDWKMAKEITDCLKRFDPVDPLKYDLSLCHLGISGACPLKPDPEKCRVCLLKTECSHGKRFSELRDRIS